MEHMQKFPEESRRNYETRLPDLPGEVPFVADQLQFDVDDFSKLTNGHTTELIEQGPDIIPKLGLSASIPSFLQSWLFFSLLSRVLGVKIHVERFVRHDSRFVTTEDLPHLLQEWESREQSAERDNDRERRHIHIDSSLDDASNFVSNWCHEGDKWDLPPNLWLSIAILGETLTRARLKILPARGIPEWENFNERRWGGSKSLEDAMVNNGWSRNTALMAQSTVGSLSGLCVVRSLKPNTNHRSCNIEECSVHTADEKNFPLHARNCDSFSDSQRAGSHLQNCRTLELHKGEVAGILRRGNIPLVALDSETFTNDHGLLRLRDCIQVREYDPATGTICSQELTVRETETEYRTLQRQTSSVRYNATHSRYVAVSHVWADGLGNSNANALPQCRFSELQQMVDDLYRDKGRCGHTLFWLDTLGIPVSPELREIRKMGIRQMSKVYEHADKVLVLDQGLQNADCHNGLEPLIRINMSRWARKLWTLQEGFLSKDLCFRFKDGQLLRTKDIEERFLAADKNLHLSWIDAAQIFNPAIRSLRERSDENIVAHLWQAVQWRSSQNAEDETVCLASLLDIDPAELQHTCESPDQKMGRFISMLEEKLGIPPGMIFLPEPKLDVEGLRWAPKTWMGGQRQDYPYPLFLESQPTFLTKRGLIVQYPGIRLDMQHIPQEREFWVSTASSLTEWYLVRYIPERHSHAIAKIHPHWCELYSAADKPFAIVLSRPKPQQRPEIAILVSIVAERERDNMKWVHSLCRVWINLETSLKKITQLSHRFKEGDKKMTWGRHVTDIQRWCVDGAFVGDLNQGAFESTRPFPRAAAPRRSQHTFRGAQVVTPPPVPKRKPFLTIGSALRNPLPEAASSSKEQTA